MDLQRNKCKRRQWRFQERAATVWQPEWNFAAVRRNGRASNCTFDRSKYIFKTIEPTIGDANEGNLIADEVTKKDLQSLQGYVNKQLKEIEGRLKKSEDNISILKDVPTKQDETISKLLMESPTTTKN